MFNILFMKMTSYNASEFFPTMFDLWQHLSVTLRNFLCGFQCES